MAKTASFMLCGFYHNFKNCTGTYTQGKKQNLGLNLTLCKDLAQNESKIQIKIQNHKFSRLEEVMESTGALSGMNRVKWTGHP